MGPEEKGLAPSSSLSSKFAVGMKPKVGGRGPPPIGGGIPKPSGDATGAAEEAMEEPKGLA